MNELLYNFVNQIEDVNKIIEMSVDEFAALVKSNKLISEEDAKSLIESFKKIASKKSDAEDDSDQKKKKYRVQNRNTEIKNIEKQEVLINDEQKDIDKEIER